MAELLSLAKILSYGRRRPAAQARMTAGYDSRGDGHRQHSCLLRFCIRDVVSAAGATIAVVLTFTLETNSLIDLEDDTPAAVGVRALLARHAARTACVRMVATVASERQRDGSILPNFSLFQERLAKAGIGHIELLMPVAVVDLTYLDWCVLAADDGSDEALQRRIHAVLFDSPFDYADAVLVHPAGAERHKAERRWRNRQLDVLGLHCHISSGADVFVTSDVNFVKPKKRAPLAALGAPVILDPVKAEAYAAAGLTDTALSASQG